MRKGFTKKDSVNLVITALGEKDVTAVVAIELNQLAENEIPVHFQLLSCMHLTAHSVYL